MSSAAGSAEGALPISSALSEASPDSLRELFDRDPESYSTQDLARVVAELRAQRERFALAEKTASAPKGKKLQINQKINLSAEELGL